MAEDSPPIAGSDLRDLAQEIALRVIAMLGHQASGEAARSVPPDDNLVFVISSFTPEMEPSYLAITSAAQAAGLRAERVKDVPGDYRITDRILKMIGQARFIVADLTNERPNVYFELGYARGLGKTVITILRSGTNIHFDVRDWTYIEYFDSRPLENDLLQRFKFELQRSLYPVALQAVARTPGPLSGHNGRYDQGCWCTDQSCHPCDPLRLPRTPCSD
jgi:hypothetical protein